MITKCEMIVELILVKVEIFELWVQGSTHRSGPCLPRNYFWWFLTWKDDADENHIIERPSGGFSIVNLSSDWLSAFCSRAPSILKTLLSEYQINQLQIKFNEKKYLSMAERAEIAITLNITQNQVKIWFQVSFRHFFVMIAWVASTCGFNLRF